VVRPKLSYACHIWAHTIPNRFLDNLSRQLQRWALTKMGPIREHTPTAGLEVITFTSPLSIHLHEIALKTILRFKNIYFSIAARQGTHIQHWEEVLTNASIQVTNCDRSVNQLGLEFHNLEEPNPHQHLGPEEDFAIFTDGSKTGKIPDNLTPYTSLPSIPCYGSGFYIEWDKTKSRIGFYPNGNRFSVYLSEIRAIKLALQHFNNESFTPKRVTIYTDSKSALQGILKLRSTSITVRECWSELVKLDSKTKWSIQWVKAHSNINGNEIADRLAKRAAQISGSQNIPFQRIAPDFINKQLREVTLQKWSEYWHARPDCRQTKLWFKEPNSKKSIEILALNREDFGLITRWITGHCYLARHQSLVHVCLSPESNLCGQGPETPWHLLRECPTFNTFISYIDWQVIPLLKSIRKIRFLEVPEYQ